MGDLATVDGARQLTDQIKTAVEGAWNLIREAYTSRAWAALGYESWDGYCSAEFGTSRLRLPREERQEVVGSLRDAGLSTRAIAAATGLARNTVMKQLAQSDPVDRPAMITSLDGRERPATQPSRPEQVASSDADLLAGRDWSPATTSPTPVVEPGPPRKPPVNVVRTVIGALADIDRGRRSLDRLDLGRLAQQDAETRRMWAAGLDEHLDAMQRVSASLKENS